MASPTTSSSSQDLPALGQAFADYLEATNLYPGLKTVHCTAQQGRLVLTARHRAPEIDDPRALLRDLEAAFLDLMPSIGLPDAGWAKLEAMPVRICLKLKSASQPYATHTFTWRLEDAARIVFPPAAENVKTDVNGAIPPSGAATDAAQTDAGKNGQAKGSPEVEAPAGLVQGTAAAEPVADGTVAEDSPMAHSSIGAGDEPPEAIPFSDTAIALPDATIDCPDSLAWLRGGWGWTLKQAQALSQYWIYGLAGVIVLGSGLFAYALSRPCVVGGCERLEDAEGFYGDAQSQLTGNPDGETLQIAQTDLQAAIDLLSPIPHWSAYYKTAQANLQQYQSDVVALNALIRAKDIAFQAATLSQDPPHSVERWVDVQLFWQQAVDLLETIPANSPAYSYAQQKLEEYRTNHKIIGRRITAEEEAEANFSTAMQTAQLAQQRMDTAESLPGWQLAANEWQAAIKGLSLVPRGTSAYNEAQTYLQDYRQQLAKTSAQANLEESSSQFYQQAVQAAREAKAYEAKNQWTLAVTQWRRAVTSAQQMSPESTLGSEAVVLLETYEPALANAQNRLRTAVALQQLTQTVGSVCEGSATPCRVSEDPTQIQITLSSQYAEPLRQAITPPTADGTFAFTNELSQSVQALLEDIMTISHQVDRQIAIYDAHGGFVARYRPDLGGFIKN